MNQDTIKDKKDLVSVTNLVSQMKDKNVGNYSQLTVEREVSDDIKNLVDKFSYCMKFYEKFCKVSEKLEFKYLDSKSQIRENYINSLKNFSWL